MSGPEFTPDHSYLQVQSTFNGAGGENFSDEYCIQDNNDSSYHEN